MTVPTPSAGSRQDRRLRIELLRMRAGYERLALGQSACRLADSLRPRALATQAGDWLRDMGFGWLGAGLGSLRRYPLILSLLGSLVSNSRRRRIALKTALIAGLVWLGRRHRRDADTQG